MNKELIAIAQQAKSAEELITLAEKSSILISEEQAKKYFDHFHTVGELGDDELESAAGGSSGYGYPSVYGNKPGCARWVHRNCGGTCAPNNLTINSFGVPELDMRKRCSKCANDDIFCYNCQHAVGKDGDFYHCNA